MGKKTKSKIKRLYLKLRLRLRKPLQYKPFTGEETISTEGMKPLSPKEEKKQLKKLGLTKEGIREDLYNFLFSHTYTIELTHDKVYIFNNVNSYSTHNKEITMIRGTETIIMPYDRLTITRK